MSTHATGTIDIKTWDEKPYNESEGLPKLTRASVTTSFHGDIEAESSLEYLMVYPEGANPTYIGMERVVGHIGERSGSFVLQHSGTFEDGTAKTTWFVVPGSGTGDLRGLSGKGNFVASHEPPRLFTLDYDFE